MATKPKHPENIKQAIRAATREQINATEIRRRLEAGQLLGVTSPYPMPQSTVDYYVRQTRKKDASSNLTPLANDPSRAVDHLARQLISETEIGIREARASQERDPEVIKRWADVLKVLGPLLRPTEDKPKRTRRTDKPADPLTSRLTTTTEPSPVDEGEKTEPDQAGPPPINHATTATEPHQPRPGYGLAAVLAATTGGR